MELEKTWKQLEYKVLQEIRTAISDIERKTLKH